MLSLIKVHNDRHLKIRFSHAYSRTKCLSFDWNSLNYVPKFSIENQPTFPLGNALGSNRWEEITWSKDDRVFPICMWYIASTTMFLYCTWDNVFHKRRLNYSRWWFSLYTDADVLNHCTTWCQLARLSFVPEVYVFAWAAPSYFLKHLTSYTGVTLRTIEWNSNQPEKNFVI